MSEQGTHLDHCKALYRMMIKFKPPVNEMYVKAFFDAVDLQRIGYWDGTNERQGGWLDRRDGKRGMNPPTIRNLPHVPR